METHIVLGQGIAGSTLAWQLHWAGHSVHIVDRGEPVSASRIAAGLITPVTGRRFSKADDFDSCRSKAEDFYRRVETIVSRPLLEENPAERYFRDHQERDYFLKERASALEDDIELMVGDDGTTVGLRMLKAARLRVLDYLNSTRDYFAEHGQYHQAEVNAANDIMLLESGVRLLNPAIEGTRLFFCQGFQAQTNPWFPGIPDAPSRGEILKIRIPGRTDQQVSHRGYWLAPGGSQDSKEDNRQFIIGATYDRENLTATVTDQGREELIQGLRQITKQEAEIVGQVAAIRAGTRQRRPVYQLHSDYQQLAILNGLGSRASLLAPMAAEKLIERISDRASPSQAGKQKPRSLIKLAHSIAGRAIKPGDTVIDATAGNGHDTLYLARCVGKSGQVISIDLQESAIQSTRARMDVNGISGVQQLAADHGEELSRRAAENQQAKVIMFNLGYLPGGDKQQTTSPASTVKAITAGLRMLSPGGVMTVVAYRGHSGGKQEAQSVEDLANRQEKSEVTAEVIPGEVNNSESPVLYVFRKK